jgi:sortase A
VPEDVEQVPARRPNRFDRPKEPHDWRWVLGIVGRTLVSIGVLLFAFVAYQWWGTGIQTAREQNRLRHEFAVMMESTVPLTSLPPPTTVEPSTSEAPAESSTSSTSTTSTIPVAQVPPAVIAPPEPGGPVAQLDIPKMDVNAKVVVEGVAPSNLQDGPGHFPETPLPGQLGNSAIAGHRTTHGHPFLHIDRLEAGDDIKITTLAGTYIYVVTGTQIVSPDDYALVIPTVDPTKATLTLTSCHPVRQATKRIVVFAELDVARSSPVTQPSNASAEQAPSVLPGDETTAETLTTDAAATTTEQAASTATTATATTATTAEATTVGPAGTVPALDASGAPPADSTETFQNDWFSDPAAMPQVARWGFVLIAISLGAYAVSWRARRNWVGALVGIVPFVVVLYFWFENVNRLLPPNL